MNKSTAITLVAAWLNMSVSAQTDTISLDLALSMQKPSLLQIRDSLCTVADTFSFDRETDERSDTIQLNEYYSFRVDKKWFHIKQAWSDELYYRVEWYKLLTWRDLEIESLAKVDPNTRTIKMNRADADDLSVDDFSDIILDALSGVDAFFREAKGNKLKFSKVD